MLISETWCEKTVNTSVGYSIEVKLIYSTHNKSEYEAFKKAMEKRLPSRMAVYESGVKR